MFIEELKAISQNPEGIICVLSTLRHTIPSGLRANWFLFFYKHIFPSGI
jgi:hypothetical protein